MVLRCCFVVLLLVELSLSIIYHKSFTKPKISSQNHHYNLISPPAPIFFLKEFVARQKSCFKPEAALESLKPLTLVEETALPKMLYKWANVFENHFNFLQDVWLALT